MTAQDRTTIKSKFEQGDKPQGSDYVDWVDSTVFLADTTVQALSSPLTVTGALGASTTVSAQSVETSALSVTGHVSANSASFVAAVSAQSVHASSATITGAVSAGSLWVGGQRVEVGASASMCEAFIVATAAAPVSAAAGFSVIPGTVSADSSILNDFSASTTLLQVQYIGDQQKTFHATGHFSVENGNNKLLAFVIGKNAAPLTRSEQQRFISTGTDVGAASVGVLVTMVSGDTVSLMSTNRTDTTQLTFRKAMLVVVEA